MIQLKSALEELGRVALVPGVRPPVWQGDRVVRELVDGPVREWLLDGAGAPERQALLAGALWPRLAVDLARLGVFVTVIDESPARIRAVQDLVVDAGLVGQVTLYQDDYKTRQFSAAGFHLALVWDTLNRYNEVEPLIKKLHRELKTGGKLLLRAAATSPDAPAGLGGAEPAVRQIAAMLVGSVPGALERMNEPGRFLKPNAHALDRDDLLAITERHLVVERTLVHHALLPDLAELAAAPVPALRRLLPALRRLDERLVARSPERGRYVAIVAAKEKSLGRVFNAPG